MTKDSILVEEYQYWPDGTRSYEMNTLRGIPGRTFDYDNKNHLLNAGTTTYQYDVDGFLTDKIQGLDTTEYVYSSRGELLQVDLPNGTVIEYVHDPLGRRIAKRIDGIIEEKYLWQGLTRLLAVYDGNDALVMRFEYADARLPVAMTRSESTYYLAYDQVGSLRVVADTSGNVVKRVDYDSFGNVTGDTNPTFDIPFGFAGGLHDRDTSLVRFGYRDYDPDVGRWTAKDPIGFAGGDTDLYGYCLNDPVNWIDYVGLDATSWGGDGRSVFDGPKNGNWCGKNWCGGQNPQKHDGRMGTAAPADSMDAACKRHDLCYASGNARELCDGQFVDELEGLDKDPRKWPNPPPKGTEEDSEKFRKRAIWYFD